MEAKTGNVAMLERLITRRNERLLQHEYFWRCKEGRLSRAELLEIVEQLYCFSVFFERVLARRLAEYTSARDERVVTIARRHMREAIGHAQMFRDCLLANGRSAAEVALLAPRMFTKALFGYLTVTVQHENEYVANVAIMQVMESIGFHFFSATLAAMRSHGMLADALAQYGDDEGHAHLGIELAADFDAATMIDCERVVDDLYTLMDFVLREWLGPADARRTCTPPPARVVVEHGVETAS